MREMAVSERNGSFAQFVAAPARQMFLVPPQTPPEAAGLGSRAICKNPRRL
jgi:NADPH:quinone reductase-like Zn-dependent oxidoreductase